MKCSKCPAPAFLRVDSRIVLCASCWNAVADRMIADLNSVASMDLAPCDVIPAASLVPTGSSAVAGDNSELMCVEPSSIRVLDAGRSGRTDCSPIDSIGRDPVDGAVKAWSPGLRAVTGDNSQSALAPEMAADSAAAPDLSDRLVAVAGNNPVAKEPEANASELRCGFGAKGSSRRGTSRFVPTTSENLDVTAGETAPNSFDPVPSSFDLSIPESIKRDSNNIAPFARLA
jgi:hypothetical protein